MTITIAADVRCDHYQGALRLRLKDDRMTPEERDVLEWALGVAYREATRSEGLAGIYPRSAVDGGGDHGRVAAIYRGRAAVLRGMLDE